MENFPDWFFNRCNWQEKTLGEVAEFLDEKRKPIEKGKRISGKYPYYGSSGIIDYVEDYIFDEELVLLSEDNFPISSFLVRGKIWVNNHAHVLRIKKNFDAAFIATVLKTIDYKKYIVGTAQPKLNQATAKNLKIKVPPLEEQKKIANYFTTLDDMIDSETKILDSLKRMKKNCCENYLYKLRRNYEQKEIFELA